MKVTLQAVTLALTLASCTTVGRLGDFDRSVDVGDVVFPGEVRVTDGVYRITGQGENIWGYEDAFHFLYRIEVGDLEVSTDIDWIGEGRDPHRKAGWMLRGGLSEDDVYVDAVLHGDGLISMQYRSEKGGPTEEMTSRITGPATLTLRREGFSYTMLVEGPSESEEVGPVQVELSDPVFAGLAVTSHHVTDEETAVFRNVELRKLGEGR